MVDYHVPLDQGIIQEFKDCTGFKNVLVCYSIPLGQIC